MAWQLKPERGALWAGLAGGVGAALGGQAPFGLWPATVLGLAVGVWLLRRADGWRVAAWRGWALGAGYFALTLIWIVQPFFVDPWRHGWMAPPFAIVLMAGGAGAVLGGCGLGGVGGAVWPLVLADLHERGGAVARLAVHRLSLGGRAGGVGMVDTPVAQGGASLLGAAGLTFLTFALVTALSTQRVAAVTALVLLGGLAWMGGGWRDGPPVAQTDTLLRIVQPNAAQHLKWDPEHAHRFVERQIALSASPPAARRPDLVIWPETAVPYLLRHADPVLRRAAAAAQAPR